MLPYAAVCCRMRTYADVCWRKLTDAGRFGGRLLASSCSSRKRLVGRTAVTTLFLSCCLPLLELRDDATNLPAPLRMFHTLSLSFSLSLSLSLSLSRARAHKHTCTHTRTHTHTYTHHNHRSNVQPSVSDQSAVSWCWHTDSLMRMLCFGYCHDMVLYRSKCIRWCWRRLSLALRCSAPVSPSCQHCRAQSKYTVLHHMLHTHTHTHKHTHTHTPKYKLVHHISYLIPLNIFNRISLCSAVSMFTHRILVLFIFLIWHKITWIVTTFVHKSFFFACNVIVPRTTRTKCTVRTTLTRTKRHRPTHKQYETHNTKHWQATAPST
jgi:hypothetical protein